MSTIAVTSSQRRALAITTAVALGFGAYFLWHYFTLIVFAAIVAFLFNPLYLRLLHKWRSPAKAVTATLIATFLTLIVPLVGVLYISVNEITQLVDKVSGVDIGSIETQIIDSVNQLLQRFSIDFVVTPEWVKAELTEIASKVGGALAAGLASFLGNFFSLFSTAIIYIFVFMSLLTKQKQIIELAQKINPLGREIGKLYQDRIAAMAKAMVKGQFIIAFLQGLVDATLLYIAGLQDLFFFFLVLLTALSVIPLGGGIIAIPIGIVMIFTGKIWQGLLVVLGHILIVTNIDNVLRPRLVPKQARLDSALMLLSVFSGIHFFGFLGIVIGPVLMILIVTTIQVFVEVFHGEEAVDRSVAEKSTRIAKRLQFWKAN